MGLYSIQHSKIRNVMTRDAAKMAVKMMIVVTKDAAAVDTKTAR